jgi:hypothetical protein
LLAFRLASREKAAAFDIRAIGQAYEEIFLSICKAGEQKTP